MRPNHSMQSDVPPMGYGASLTLFGIASIALILTTHCLIPMLSQGTGREPILFWFLTAGLGIFTPLILIAGGLLYQEGPLNREVWSQRLRFRALSRSDWLWSLGGILAIGLGTAGIVMLLHVIWGGVDLHPPFMEFQPLAVGRYGLLAAWMPFWVVNIMGEEILWRGVVLPRQEARWGTGAWLMNSLGWALFHIAFGWQLWLTLLPILLILPYLVQRCQNSWVGVVIHAGINGPGFLAVAFGLV